jgi:hypothetical protein
MTKRENWWGDFHFTVDDVKSWQLGARSISIKRRNQEWTIWDNTTDTEEDEPLVIVDNVDEQSLIDVACSRILVTKTSDTLTIEPSLADRAMIVRPSRPLIVLPDEKIQVYISTPIWFTVLLTGRDLPLKDIPFWRPSDSWFGPSTMEGDLCYSKYTDAKIDKEHLLKRAHRANTRVSIKNNHEEPLVIERLNLPVPAFKLYVDESGEFWTDQISIVQNIEHAKPVSHIEQSQPDNWQNMSVVSESRELSTKASFLSSIKNLIA